MHFSRFGTIWVLVLTCYWKVVSSKAVDLVSSASRQNSLSVSNRLRQWNDPPEIRENSAKAYCPAKKLSPTIKPFSPFNPKADADSLYYAMAGAGTDEQTLIDILTHRTYEQRSEIAHAFDTNKKYGWDIPFVDWISDEAEGIWQDVMDDLVKPPKQVLTDDLLWAVKGPGTNEQILIDILVPMTTTEKKRVKSAFKAKSGYSLRYYVVSDTEDEGEFASLLRALIEHYRPDDGCVDLAKAKTDAATLGQKFQEMQMNSRQYQKCERCTDYDIEGCQEFCTIKHRNWLKSFHDILVSRSWVQLKKTFEIYKEKHGRNVAADIPKVFDYWSWYKTALLSIYQFTMDSNGFFAEALARDMYWFDRDASWAHVYSTARVFAWRSEIDLGDIATAFSNKYRMTLSEYIMTYVRGDSKSTLLSILH